VNSDDLTEPRGERGAAYACAVAASAAYRGSLVLRDAVLGARSDLRALALTCWDDSFALHGIQPLPTPLPPGPLGMRDVEITTDIGSKHYSPGLGGHGHPRFLWHAAFEPAFPPGVSALTLSATAMPDGAAVTALIPLPHWPPTRREAVARETTGPTQGRTTVDRVGSPLPDQVIALNTDLGVVAQVRRALTVMYRWPAWFLLTVEARGFPMQETKRSASEQAWEMDDDRGNRYLGMDTGGWSGPDSGAHIAFAPGLDPLARELRLSFPDPFGQVGSLTAVVSVPHDGA
jgi:hypothetical protein